MLLTKIGTLCLIHILANSWFVLRMCKFWVQERLHMYIGLSPETAAQTGLGPGKAAQTGLGPGKAAQTGLGPGKAVQTGLGPGKVAQTGLGPGKHRQDWVQESTDRTGSIIPSYSLSLRLSWELNLICIDIMDGYDVWMATTFEMKVDFLQCTWTFP